MEKINKVVLGLDIGGTTSTFGFVDDKGNLLAENKILTLSEEPVTRFLPRLFVGIRALLAQLPASVQLSGIGIGAPNANYHTGNIENPPNLRWGPVTNICELLKNEFKVPVVLTNDANAAAVGEMRFGSAKGMKDFIMITMGTGLGSGIVVNGRLVYGHDGFAGELGHTLVNVNGRFCGCGRRGCLETYVSATGIRRTVYKLLADYTDPSPLRKVAFDDLSAEMISDHALKGDKIAMLAFEYTGRILGMKLADAVVHTSPEAIFLFGGLANAKDLIFQPAYQNMEAHMTPIFKGKVKLAISGLQGQNAAVLGAAALILDELEHTS